MPLSDVHMHLSFLCVPSLPFPLIPSAHLTWPMRRGTTLEEE